MEKMSKYHQTLGRQQALDLEKRLQILYIAVEDLKEKLKVCVQKHEMDFQVGSILHCNAEMKLQGYTYK